MTNEIAIRPDQPVSFRLLGSVQMEIGGRLLNLGPEQEQLLLVALLSAEGAPVTRDRLMEIIWDGRPASGASDALHHHVRSLRRRLEHVGLMETLPRSSHGTYRLDIPADQVDVHRFHKLSKRAHEYVGNDDRLTVGLLGEALRLRRGEPLAGLGGHWADGYRHMLIEEHHTAELIFNEAALRLGQQGEQLPKLQSLYRDRPEDEWVAWLYMHALYRAGRQADALAVYREVCEHLDQTIAADSLSALAELHQRMLRRDDGLLSPEAVMFPVGRPYALGATPRDAGDSDCGHASQGSADRTSATSAEPTTDREPAAGSADAAVINRVRKVTAEYVTFGISHHHGRDRGQGDD